MFYNAKNGKVEIDNTTANYISFGSGNKNLIIIPGVGDGLRTVKGLAIPFSIMYKVFSRKYKVYVFSRRNDIPDDFSTEDMANDIIKHMEKLKIEKTSVVGVSQGGMIAQYIAINAPQKVDKLVLAVTVSRPNETIIDSIEKWIELAEEKDYKGIMIDSAERSYTGKYLEKNRKVYKLLGLFGKNANYKRFIIQAKSCLKHNTYNILYKIKCPTLIIGAKKDKAVGIIGSEEMVNKIEKSKIIIYEEYSHGVYEQAEDFNDKVLEFLES